MKLNDKILVTVFMALALGCALMLFVHRLMTSGDNVNYLFIAGSVINGDLLEPFQWRFPVGYPFLLAAIAKIAGITMGTDPFTISSSGIYIIKLFGVAMAPLAVLAVWVWSRFITEDRTMALLITGLYATTRHLAPLYSIIGSEPYFLLMTWLALWSWEKAVNKQAGGQERRGLFIAVVFTALAILFRQIALAIPLAVIGAVVLQGRGGSWRSRLLPAGLALALVVFGLVMMMLSDASHLEQLSGPDHVSDVETGVLAEKIQLLKENVYAYRMIIPITMLPKTLGPDGLLSILHVSFLVIPLGILMYVLCAAGFFRCVFLRGAGLVSSLYAMVTVGVMLIWPYRDVRFFIPLIPLFWFFALTGLSWFLTKVRVPKRASRWLAVWPIVLFMCWQLAVNGYAGIKNVRAMQEMQGLSAWHPARYEVTGERDFIDHLSCGLWLSENAGTNAMVYSEKAMLMGLSSGRATRYITAKESSRTAREQYVVVDSFPLTTGYGRAKLDFMGRIEEGSVDGYELVYEAPHGARIYRRLFDVSRRQTQLR